MTSNGSIQFHEKQKPLIKKDAKMENDTLETIKRIARHEAAHFVSGWAVECRACHVDIPEEPKACRYDQSRAKGGFTGGWSCDSDPFQRVIIGIAGIVADNWGKDVKQLLEDEKDEINQAIECVIKKLATDHFDWEDLMEDLCDFCDITDPTQVKQVISVFYDATRDILKLCEAQWQEVTEYLVKNRRIGFTGEYLNGIAIKDQGEEAESFFTRWGGDWGEPPAAIRDCVEKYRITASALERREG